MNKNGYRQIQYDNSADVTKIDIDSAKPFAVVLLEDCFMVTLFKDNGSVVVREN